MSGQTLNLKYRADVDGLRALAVLAVIGYHAFPTIFPGGFVGVDVFFVISGFLITSILINSFHSKRFSISDFYIRRIRRIFPALIVVLLSCFSFGWFALLADEYAQLGKHVAGGAAFVSNLTLWFESGYFDKTADLKPLLHLWSLGIEEQYYIVWPLLIALTLGRARRFTFALYGLGLASFFFNVWTVQTDLTSAFYLPQNRFWELLVGSALAYHDSKSNSRSVITKIQSLLGIALIGFSAFYISGRSLFPGWWALLPVIGTALILQAGPSPWLNRHVLSCRLLVAIGLISYPLYLWHWPLLSFAKILRGEDLSVTVRVLLISISFLLAWITYLMIERPFRFGSKDKRKALILGLTMIATFFIGLVTFVNGGWAERYVVRRNVDPNQAVLVPQFVSKPCIFAWYPMANSQCTRIEQEQASGTWVLWGDSSSQMWEPALADLARAANKNIIHFSHTSCPPFLKTRKTFFKAPGSVEYCADGKIQEQILDIVKTLHPDLIILMAAWNSYSPVSQRDFITDKESGEADAKTTNDVVLNRVPETILALAEIGRLIVFRSWPILPHNPRYNISRIEFLQKDSEERPVKMSDFQEDNEFINSVFAKISHPNLSFYDPSEKICGREGCTTTLNGLRLFKDTYHITPAGTTLFREDFARVLGIKAD